MIEINFQKDLNGSKGKMSLEVDLSIEERAFISIYGPSGAGKTSVLRILAGLMKPDNGEIAHGNDLWFRNKNKVDLPPQKRSVGLVFQGHSLFPNMTVRQNLNFAMNKGSSANIIDELIETMELHELSDTYPALLSGGQAQRVALARAIVQKPRLLLLDEPFSALHDDLRVQLQEYILKVHEEYQVTTILVSHNKEEIIKMADRVIVLEEGKIVDDSIPERLFQKNSFKIRAIVKLVDTEKSVIHVEINNELHSLNIHRSKIAGINEGDLVELELQYSAGKVSDVIETQMIKKVY